MKSITKKRKEKKTKMADESKDYMLTTYDNPFNPFTEFEAWYKEDMILGWDTCGLLARTAVTTNDDSDEIYDEEVYAAMDEIVRRFPMIFKKVEAGDYQAQTA